MGVYSGEVWQVRWVQNYLDQQVLNIFHYGVGTGVLQNAQDLADAFDAGVRQSLASIQVVNLISVRVEVQGERTATDLGLSLSGANGSVSSEGMPPYVAWAFRYNRTATTYRNGYKRIGGVPESMQNNGQPTGGALTALNAAAAVLNDSVVSLDEERTYIPLLRQTVVGKAPITPVFWTVPDGTVEWASISTQNTRKFGHGS